MTAFTARRMRKLIWLVLGLFLAGTTAARAQLRVVPYVSGLTLPVGFVQDPSNPSIQYVLEQGGTVRVILNGALLPTPFLDISTLTMGAGEQGLLGIAFPADYASSRRFYINYTNLAGHTVVARYKRSIGNPLVADPSTAFPLRWGGAAGPQFIAHPGYGNHNGGHIVFGPDGYLYIGLGDGGSANDPQNFAQNPASLLGKLLRIDVNVADSHPSGYVIPPTNPFPPGNPLGALPEIWSFGLRNPWKFSFDSPARGGTGAMFIGDVGQNAWEEIDYQPPGVGGRNYGWRNREGAHPNPNPLVGGILPYAYLPVIDPIIEHPHPIAASIIGGVVYRGSAMSAAYRGRYIYGDLTGRIWSAAIVPAANGEAAATNVIDHTNELGGTTATLNLTTIGTDSFGEIYFATWQSGTILKLVDAAAPGLPPPSSDFNRDRSPDLVWFNQTTRRLAAWNMGGGTFGERMLGGDFLGAPALPAGWNVVGNADADGDGKTDLFLQSDSGMLGVWFFDGPMFRFGMSLNPGAVTDPRWKVRAVGDFNGDGHPDLAWQFEPTGQVAFWLLNGTNVIGYAVPAVGAPGADWRVFATGDVNHDGQQDLFWQHRTLGLLAVWTMSGTQYTAGRLLSASPSDPGWEAVGACDLDRDGSTDILFQHASSRTLAAWYLYGEVVRFGALLNPSNTSDPSWRLVGPR